MRFGFVLCLFLVAACSRALTQNEEQLAHDVFGDTLDTSRVTVSKGFGLFPAPQDVPVEMQVFGQHPNACLRVPQPASDRPPPQAFALWNRVHFGKELYSGDMAAPWPHALRFPNAMIFAHELTHVWQWQNRRLTGYSPLRAAAESWTSGDPYYHAPGERPAFLSFGYEQQASILEDFLCFTFANPEHPRRAELRALLKPVLPVEDLEAALAQ